MKNIFKILQGYHIMAALVPIIRGSKMKVLSFSQPLLLNIICLVFSDLDLSLSHTGKVVKTLGDTLSVKTEKNASGDTKVSWTKVMVLGLGLGKWHRNTEVNERGGLSNCLSTFSL